MFQQGSLRLALDLLRIPALAKMLRAIPLPPDTLILIRIAAGCDETLKAAAEKSRASPDQIRSAAQLFLHQVMLHPGADNYRILGLAPEASKAQTKEHRKWLLRWLHPDVNGGNWEAVLAERVIRAWRETGRETSRASQSDDEIGYRNGESNVRRIQLPWIAHPAETHGSTKTRASSSFWPPQVWQLWRSRSLRSKA